MEHFATAVNINKHVGNRISTDIHDKAITSNVCTYQRGNSVITDLSICDSKTLNKIHVILCMLQRIIYFS